MISDPLTTSKQRLQTFLIFRTIPILRVATDSPSLFHGLSLHK